MKMFIDSPITVGNNNVVNVVHNGKNDFMWEKLKEDCLLAIQKLPQKSEERAAAETIFADAVRKDKNGLKNTVKRFATALTTNLFCSVAGSVLAEVVKSIIGK